MTDGEEKILKKLEEIASILREQGKIQEKTLNVFYKYDENYLAEVERDGNGKLEG